MMAWPVVELRQKIVGVDTSQDIMNIILVLDSNLPRDQARAVGLVITTILTEFLLQNKEDTQRTRINVGLVVFGKYVSIYQLGLDGIASADVITSASAWNEQQQAKPQQLAEKYYLRTSHTASDLECLWQCLPAHYGVSFPTNQSSSSSSHWMRIVPRLRYRAWNGFANASKHGCRNNNKQLPRPQAWKPNLLGRKKRTVVTTRTCITTREVPKNTHFVACIHECRVHRVVRRTYNCTTCIPQTLGITPLL